MIVSKVQQINNTKKSNSQNAINPIAFGLNSKLLCNDTNILLDKVIAKYNKKTQLFSDTLQTTQKKLEKRQGVSIDMPNAIGVLSSFKTGLRATLKLEVPLPNGVKLRFSNDKGYKGEYASLEKIIAGANGEEHIKYEISDSWIDVIHDDKKRNIVYTESQLPGYQQVIFKGMSIESLSNPKVYADIQKVDEEIAEYLKPFIQDKKSVFFKLLGLLKNNSSNTVGVKKYSSF